MKMRNGFREFGPLCGWIAMFGVLVALLGRGTARRELPDFRPAPLQRAEAQPSQPQLSSSPAQRATRPSADAFALRPFLADAIRRANRPEESRPRQRAEATTDSTVALIPFESRPTRDLLWNSTYERVTRQYASNSALPRPSRDLSSFSNTQLTDLWLWNSTYERVTRQYARNSALPRPSGDLSSFSNTQLTDVWLRNSGSTRTSTSSAPSSALSGSAPTRTPGVAENGSYYGELNQNGVPTTVPVRGYFRSDGTYVRGHYRSRPYSNPRR